MIIVHSLFILKLCNLCSGSLEFTLVYANKYHCHVLL
jgi:hypothetical protein